MDKGVLQKEMQRVTGMTWGGCRHGSVYTGPLPAGCGAFCFQYEGNKLMATIDMLEAMRYRSPHVEQLLEDESTKMGTNFTQLLEDWSQWFLIQVFQTLSPHHSPLSPP